MLPISIYCDESGHLENDETSVMALGSVWLPREKIPEVNLRIREIKSRHGLASNFEIKWTKVSPSLVGFYRDLIDYFFDDDDLHARILVVNDKRQLRHSDFNQDHDTWYFKMYFQLLVQIVSPTRSSHIYIDVKDTRSAPKMDKLRRVLSNSQYDQSGDVIQRLQAIRSDESQIMQICDLLMGAVAANARGTTISQAKLEVIQRVAIRSRRNLGRSTWPSEQKFNLFFWDPTYNRGEG